MLEMLWHWAIINVWLILIGGAWVGYLIWRAEDEE